MKKEQYIKPEAILLSEGKDFTAAGCSEGSWPTDCMSGDIAFDLCQPGDVATVDCRPGAGAGETCSAGDEFAGGFD